MAEAPVHARVSAVKQMDHAVAAYGRGLSGALTSARSALSSAAAEFQRAVADSGREVLQAERRTAEAAATLSGCKEGCEPLARELAAARAAEATARARHQKNLRAQAQLERASSELTSSMRSLQARSEALIPSTRQKIREYAEIIAGYLASGA